MIPNPIAGIAAPQTRPEGAEKREYFRRAPRVAAGGPQPEKYAVYNPRTASVIGNAQGNSGWNLRFPSNGRKVTVEPTSRSTNPSTMARTITGNQFHAACSRDNITMKFSLPRKRLHDCLRERTNVVDAHRDDGKRFAVRAGEKLTAFLELERAVCIHLLTEQV